MSSTVERIKELLHECSVEEREIIFRYLRRDIAIHSLEERLNTKAEVILEALHRASDLTLRGVRGIIAEATFTIDIVGQMAEWKDITPKGDFAYDCLLADQAGAVRVQIKMQRLKDHKPMMACEGYRFLPKDLYVAETQRTRGGKDSQGQATRPYKFGEFDILGVCLHPSSNNWQDFVYTVGQWLIPDPKDNQRILKFQPVSVVEGEDWTHDFTKCVSWLRSGRKKRICGDLEFPTSA